LNSSIIRRRSSGSDTINFLQSKMEAQHELRKKELQLQQDKLDLETRKQDNQNNLMLLFAQQMQRNQQLTHLMHC